MARNSFEEVYQEDGMFCLLQILINLQVSWPASITSADVKNIGVELTPQEKAHLALLVMEARKQVELMYSLRAIMNYHTHS